MTSSEQLTQIYNLLFERFGHQHWWPGETPFEIIVGAILTQNTNWTNVEKAINNLKAASHLEPQKLHQLDIDLLAQLIRPAGYYNIKAQRLKNFLNWFFSNHDGKLENLSSIDTYTLRTELLSIKGIGRETADSILLYALNRPIFVVDAYTARITARHHLIEPGCDYDQLQSLFQSNLAEDAVLFNEYHALLVQTGKSFCRPTPLCENCPLNSHPHTVNIEYF